MGLIRIKVSAIFLGPAGVGIVAQVGGVRNFLIRFVDLGVGGGVTKYVAEYNGKNDKAALERLLQTTLSIFVITGSVVFAGSWLFSAQLAELVFADSSLGLLMVLTGATVTLTAQMQVVFRTLQGMLKIKEMVILSIVTAVLGLVITIPLIILFDVTGAVFSIALSAALSYLLGQLYLHRLVLQDLGIRLRFVVPDKETTINLLRFGGASSVGVLVNTFSILFIRSMIIGQLGADSNGLYQVAFALSNRYLSIIFSAIWSYGMPKIATILNNQIGISKVQNDSMRLLYLVLVPLIVFILVFKDIWLPILYSSAFLGAGALIGWQLLGDFFRGLGWSANLSLVPKERFAFLMGFSISFSVIQVGTFLLLLPVIGLVAVPIAYMLGQALNLPLILFGHYKYDGFIYSTENWLLFFKSSVLISLTLIVYYLFNDNIIISYTVPLIGLALWGWFVITREEAAWIRQKVINLWSR